MGTSTLGLSFATMTPLIWQYARAFFNDVSPILIWVVGGVIAFFVATKLIDILSGDRRRLVEFPVSGPKTDDDPGISAAEQDFVDEYDDDDDDEE